MAVPEQIPLVNYVADGTVKKFDVPFDYDQQADLHLFVDGVEPTIDKYFFEDNAFNFYIAPTVGQKVRIERITPKKRDTDYDLHTNTVRPKALNSDFNRIWYAIQESYEDFGELSTQLQSEIIARIQSDDEILAKLAEETANRILGDTTVSNDLKNYIDQMIALIIGDPSFSGINADKILDDSGLNQQEINDSQSEINSIIDAEGVNILSVYGGIDDFGVAIELAFAKAMTTDCRKIIIPDGVFSAKTTANLTLASNFTLQFSGDTKINADNRVDVFDITQGNYTLNILGNGASIYPNWATGSGAVSVLKLDSQTLGKSLIANNLNVFKNDDSEFTYGINAVGLNYSKISTCVIQAENSIVNASALSGTSTHAMGTEIENCHLHASNTTVTLINNGELGCEGWKFFGGEYFGKTGIKVIDNLNSTAYYPPLLVVDSIHMNAERFFSLSGLSRVKISGGTDLQAQVASSSDFNGLIEFDGVQIFDIADTVTISQAATTGTVPTDSLPVYYLRNSAKGRTSAFLEFGVKNYWLNQDAPLVDFAPTVQLYGRINLAAINTNAFSGEIVLPANAKKVGISLDTVLKNDQVGTGITFSDDITFDSGTGVLTFNTAPTIGSVYQLPTSILPDNSTINQIKVNDSIGKEFTIIVDASGVTINHSANLYTPIGVQNKLLYGSILRVLSYNSDLCRILSISNHASVLTASVPASTASPGIHGQRVYSAGYVYDYFQGAGWVRHAVSSF